MLRVRGKCAPTSSRNQGRENIYMVEQAKSQQAGRYLSVDLDCENNTENPTGPPCPSKI